MKNKQNCELISQYTSYPPRCDEMWPWS